MKKYLYIIVALLTAAFVLFLAAEKASAYFVVDSKTIFDLSCSPVPVFSRSYDTGKNYTGLTALSANTGEAFCPVIVKNKEALEAYWVESKKQYTSRSIDNGASWSQPLSVFEYENEPYFVAVAKNPENKNTLIVWADKRENIFAAFSEDSSSFLAPAQINLLSPAAVPAKGGAGKLTVSSSNN